MSYVGPIVRHDKELSLYLDEVNKFPMLEPEEEYMLAKRLQEHGDTEAAHRLVTSHLRLVAKIAMSFRGYGLPLMDVISEGNIGLMQAVKKFEPDKGFKLATYAMWWIKASIQEYVLRSWSLVKIGTTAAQKKLFFNLRKIKKRIGRMDEGNLHPEDIKLISEELDVSEEEVVQMNSRLSGADFSLNDEANVDGKQQWLDLLPSKETSQETTVANRQEYHFRKDLFNQALACLNDREIEILRARKLKEPALTLDELSATYGISRERVRQIEVRAFEKVQKFIQDRVA